MKSRRRVVLCLFALVFLAGCGSSVKVTDSENLVTEKIPRPNHILVYNFAATPADAPELANQYAADATPQTAEQIQLGRQLGAQIASEVAAAFRAMGLPADAVPIGTPLEMNDIVFKGYLISIPRTGLRGGLTGRQVNTMDEETGEVQSEVEVMKARGYLGQF